MFGRFREKCEHGGRDRFEFARRGGFGPSFFSEGEDDGIGRGRGGPFGRGGRFFGNGMLRLIILALVAEQPRHGYEIIKELEERTGGLYAPSAGAIYPTLTLLEDTGEIETRQAEGAKKLFAATEAGLATLAENKAAIDAVFARFEEMGAASARGRDPRLVRAVENFKMALKLKARGGSLAPEQIEALTRLLDETARRIEEI